MQPCRASPAPRPPAGAPGKGKAPADAREPPCPTGCSLAPRSPAPTHAASEVGAPQGRHTQVQACAQGTRGRSSWGDTGRTEGGRAGLRRRRARPGPSATRLPGAPGAAGLGGPEAPPLARGSAGGTERPGEGEGGGEEGGTGRAKPRPTGTPREGAAWAVRGAPTRWGTCPLGHREVPRSALMLPPRQRRPHQWRRQCGPHRRRNERGAGPMEARLAPRGGPLSPPRDPGWAFLSAAGPLTGASGGRPREGRSQHQRPARPASPASEGHNTRCARQGADPAGGAGVGRTRRGSWWGKGVRVD